MKKNILSRRSFIVKSGLLSALLPFAPYSSVKQALAGMQGKVKITAVKTAVVQSRYTWNFVRIETDAGVTGIGEAFCSPGVPALIKRFHRVLIGQDPLNVENLYDRMMGSSFSWQTGISNTAAAGVEIALWDLAGKLLNVPCYQFLGGLVRDKVPLYCDSGAPSTLEPAAWKDYGYQISDRNYTFYKVDADPITRRKPFPRDPANRSISNKELDLIVKSLAAVREALGDKEMAVDCHGRYDTSDAIRLANAIQDLRLVFLEDPIPTFNFEAYKKVTDSTNTTICTGENLYEAKDFRPFIVNQACDILQPDTTKTGGLLQTKQIADLADLYYIPVAVHNLNSPVGTMASVHVCATIANFKGLEFKFERPDWWDDVIVTDKPMYQDGFVVLQDKPGLGIELNDQVCKSHKHPDYPYFE